MTRHPLKSLEKISFSISNYTIYEYSCKELVNVDILLVISKIFLGGEPIDIVHLPTQTSITPKKTSVMNNYGFLPYFNGLLKVRSSVTMSPERVCC